MSKDFEQLSAYIDNQLSPREKADLEARLAKETELQATLNDLRRMVGALRTLPPVKPPRSFTLTTQQVGARARRGPLFSVFRLSAALATLLLAVTVARDFTTSSLSASTTSDLTTQSGAVTLVVPNAAVLATPTPESVIETYGASAPLPTGSPSADGAVTPFTRLAPNGADETATPGVDQSAATADATNKNLAPTETPADTAVSVAALPPSATQTETVAQNLVAQPNVSAQSELRVAEIVLAALALALAAAAWFTRRG